jgi:uncharacterized protein involved in response to NO
MDRPFALWNLGFRPFYLLASAFAAISVALWVLQYGGLVPVAYLQSPVWHGHEMLFGFALAVITGFLFTAVRNWTGRPTPTGAVLATIALLWLAGRLLALGDHPVAAALVNAAFPIAVAVGVGIPLVRSANRRNYFFVGLLVLVSAAALAVHLAYAGVIAWPARAGLQVGLDIVLFIMSVMGGRVIPMFTNNAIPGANASRNPWVEKLALGGVLALVVADVLFVPAGVLAALAFAAALAHAVRFFLFRPWRTLSTPLVWALHAAYAWIVLYLALRGLAALGLVAEPVATHALTVGAIGGLIIAMITRTARGHTGEPLKADRFDTTCYVLVQAAAIVRVFGGLLLPSMYVATVVLSGLFWSSAFALYAVRYWPRLSRSRIDGKPG